MTSGECLLSICIQGKEFTIKFLDTHQLRHSLILGLPWLETEQAILDLTRHVLYVGHDTRVTIPLVRAPQQRKRVPLFDATMVKHGLASPHQETLLKLLQTYAEVFSPLCQGLPQTRTIQHEYALQRINLFVYPHTDIPSKSEQSLRSRYRRCCRTESPSKRPRPTARS